MLVVGWMFFLDGILFGAVSGAVIGRSAYRVPRDVWLRGALAASISMAAYVIVVWAMTVAPIALVTALRETSILFAVLIGWLWFGERMDRGKATAALAIVAGIVLTRLA